jgi:hypothetical protein
MLAYMVDAISQRCGLRIFPCLPLGEIPSSAPLEKILACLPLGRIPIAFPLEKERWGDLTPLLTSIVLFHPFQAAR